ncbi:MAG: hypothetical protein OHK0023_22720 [Anaerolineae bacterium]
MQVRLTYGKIPYAVRVEQGKDGYRIQIGDRSYLARLLRMEGGQIAFQIGDQSFTAHIAQTGDDLYVALDGMVHTLSTAAPKLRREASPSGGAESLNATMHGQVVKVLVNEGDMVQKGQALIILEAMKMEIRVSAPHDGQVTHLACAVGQVVERGQLLLNFATS